MNAEEHAHDILWMGAQWFICTIVLCVIFIRMLWKKLS